MNKPSYVGFDHKTYKWSSQIDYEREPQLYGFQNLYVNPTNQILDTNKDSREIAETIFIF